LKDCSYYFAPPSGGAKPSISLPVLTRKKSPPKMVLTATTRF
jgi:hypothetical protein